MERSIFKLIKPLTWFAVIVGTIFVLAIAHAENTRELVLVALKESPIETLTSRDVRRIYLGVPIRVSSKNILPVRNTSDSLLYEMFLQKVVYLSARDYERQLISRTFRRGGMRPTSLDEQNKIILFLRTNPSAVTFMWADAASKHQDIKVVKSLWKGSIE